MCGNPFKALGGVVGSIFGGNAALKAQKKAQAAAEAQAASDAQRSEEQFNRANQKQPDIASLLSRNQEAANQGLAATFLTGPAGVNSGALTLGKTTLLGGGS